MIKKRIIRAMTALTLLFVLGSCSQLGIQCDIRYADGTWSADSIAYPSSGSGLVSGNILIKPATVIVDGGSKKVTLSGHVVYGSFTSAKELSMSTDYSGLSQINTNVIVYGKIKAEYPTVSGTPNTADNLATTAVSTTKDHFIAFGFTNKVSDNKIKISYNFYETADESELARFDDNDLDDMKQAVPFTEFTKQ